MLWQYTVSCLKGIKKPAKAGFFMIQLPAKSGFNCLDCAIEATFMTGSLVGVDDTLVSHTVNYRDGVSVCGSGLIVILAIYGSVNLLYIGTHHGAGASVLPAA